MDKLTTEQKAKRYDEAIEKLRSLHDDYDTVSTLIDIKEELENIFPELKESEDEKMKESCKFFLNLQKINSPHSISDIDKCISWLEKQGKQEKPQVYDTGDGEVITYSETEGDKVVEPEFHKGDWVVSGQFVTQIREIAGDGYVNSHNGFIPFESAKYYYLWTIQDAKEGDVLFHSDSASNGIFIFKEIIDKGFAKEVICYCDYDSEDHFCLGEHHTCCWTDAKILYPATKEQRDTLMKAIADAGYAFDFEKKELKEIKQKPAEWSEEDESQMQGIIELLLGLSIRHNWLKSLKDRVQPQPKQDWSERDKEEFQIAIDTLAEAGQHDSAHWLKSLKDRIQPHKQWKPSEEQIKAFEHFVRSIGESGYVSPYENNTKLLYSLLEQLKKL